MSILTDNQVIFLKRCLRRVSEVGVEQGEFTRVEIEEWYDRYEISRPIGDLLGYFTEAGYQICNSCRNKTCTCKTEQISDTYQLLIEHIIEDVANTINNETGNDVRYGLSTEGWWIIGVNRDDVGWIYLHINSNAGEHGGVSSRLEVGHIVVSLLNDQQAGDSEDIWLWFELLRENDFDALDELILQRTGQYAMPVYDQTGEVGRQHRASIRRHAKLYLTHNGFEEVNATEALSGIGSGIVPSSVLFSVENDEGELIVFCNCDAKDDDYHFHYISEGILSNPRNSEVACEVATKIESRLAQRESLSETMRGLSGRAKLTAIFGGLGALSLLGATAIGWLFDSLNSTLILRIFQLGLTISGVAIIAAIGYPILRDQLFTWDIRPWYIRRLKPLIALLIVILIIAAILIMG